MGGMSTKEQGASPAPAKPAEAPEAATPQAATPPRPHLPPEVDGPKGPEPTRYGDWERKGRVSDF